MVEFPVSMFYLLQFRHKSDDQVNNRRAKVLLDGK